jgi:hypothetical protein
MALAAAQRLIGTDASLDQAAAGARLAIENTGGFANRYDFGQIVVGEGSGRLASPMPEVIFYDTLAAANGTGGGNEGSSGSARHARVEFTADAPLIFWGFLSLAQERKTSIAARAVAGISSPLCTACGIEPIAIAPISADDTTDFGFTPDTQYTFGFFCNGAPQPSGLAGAPQRIQYLLLDRYNDEASIFADEGSQLYRAGAGGLPPSTDPARSCFNVSGVETQWVSAAPALCSTNTVAPSVRQFLCGMASRFEATIPSGCDTIADVDSIASAYRADTDINLLEAWSAYTGNVRRVITVPIVDVLTPGSNMNVLGFRQFVVQPNLNAANISPNDNNGRFSATYIGSRVPLRGGSFGGCSVTGGPGKVVLHE